MLYDELKQKMEKFFCSKNIFFLYFAYILNLFILKISISLSIQIKLLYLLKEQFLSKFQLIVSAYTK